MTTAAQMVNTALKYVGVLEAPLGSNRQIFGERYGWNGVAWCNIFISEIAKEASGSYDLVGGKFAYTVYHLKRFQALGRLHSTPKVGDIGFIRWPGSTELCDHVVLIRGDLNSANQVPSVEGNTSVVVNGRTVNDGVGAKLRHASLFVGFGRPFYTPPPAIVKPVPKVVGKFPLPFGHFYGMNDGTQFSHSGFRPQDRSAIKLIQAEIRATVDGIYGPETKKKVVEWQKANKPFIHGHEVDGKVGYNTWMAMTKY